MPRLIVTIDQLPYAGTMYRKGDKFFASDEDARLLKGFGKAADAPSGHDTRSMQADAFAEGEQPKQSRRGRYKRSDMRAED